MIKEIKIYSRLEMQQYASHNRENFPYKHWYLISIHSGDILVNKNTRSVFESIGCKGILSLEFYDMTPEDQSVVMDNNPQAILFDTSHAKRIITFLDRIQKDIIDSTLVIHCHAGISRSGAVGTFACDYYGLDYGDFIEKNTHISPNYHVIRVLRNEAKMTPSFSYDGDKFWIDKIDKILNERNKND